MLIIISFEAQTFEIIMTEKCLSQLLGTILGCFHIILNVPAKIPESSDMKSVFEKLPIVFVTGGPGSGKGTQCDKIVKEFNFTHLSSGDLLRAKVASGSPDGQELEAVMKAGKLVPLEKVLDLITEAMTEAVAQGSCNGFLIDGYPREIDQGLKFEEQVNIV